MLLIPAIDLKGGRCVRLRQGRMEEETIFDDNPLRVADRWYNAGAQRLHIVDLDGAVVGRPVNIAIVRNMCTRYPDIPVQIGGGIRDQETVAAYLEAGASYVIIGTRAVQEPAFVRSLCQQFPGRVIVGLDARGSAVATEGWLKTSGHSLLELARQFENDGVEAIIYTDISRDGMLSGVNLEMTAALADTIRIPVIAAGGVKSLADIQALGELSGTGVLGAITGRAIYEGTLDFAEGLQLAAGYPRSQY
ncbi:MAG TPA: 1-(5-phosphoribosyl)-5-[(5-phosphoribosylamino)methylideneamino]imidazole-4-carboxamide isomerase [Gammaproteobacteria bacterium]|nr:1-(5-phosphoribosyl)-5-[(5-phosphoribosylamino)methylideneamino]imidazole-4-carboxamide isomerase [Gammaproteobacteria bacterium]